MKKILRAMQGKGQQ